MLDSIIHRWLKIPYTLHTSDSVRHSSARITVVLIHGLGSSEKMWQQTISRLANQSSVRIIAIDLLGFGQSPKPSWQTYSAETHARALHATLKKHRVRTPVILVGHSLGSLIAVHYAARYKASITSLILCSPPLYRPARLNVPGSLSLPQIDDLYRKFYRHARSRQDLARKLALIIKQARLIDPNFTITDETLPAIASSLELSIENQTTLRDIVTLAIPVTLVYGQFDPFVVKRNLIMLAKNHVNISVESVMAGHDIIGSMSYVNRVVLLIQQEAKRIAG